MELLNPGSVQWMTAGRGIIHSEMPEISDGSVWGYQLWINLPSRLKMIEPHYQDIPASRIPVIEWQGARVKVIAGDFHGSNGPAQSRFPVLYFDVDLSRDHTFSHPVPQEMNCFCYLYEGAITLGPEEQPRDVGADSAAGRMIVLGDGDSLLIRATSEKAGFLLVAGNRIGEPVARAGPFVMNTREELYRAFEDYRSGRLAT
ncbi:MAG: pirin family protein [Acidobacteriia bacterium]|nr:pirin family protein [Terriglobia bacterium]